MSRYDQEVEACTRKIRQLGFPRGSWLRSEDPYKFAAAMSKCRHNGAFCAQDGFCHYGDCFSKKRQKDEILSRLEAI